MQLTDILDPRWIRIPLAATTREGAIAELVDILAADKLLDDPRQVLQVVLERERAGGTGIGEGIALPHGRCDGVGRLAAAVGRLQMPVDFGSPDDRPVDLIVLVLSPKGLAGQYIQVIARLGRFLSSPPFPQQLRGAAGPEEVIQAFRQKEAEKAPAIAPAPAR